MPIPKKTETINRTTAKERVYTILQQWIVDGTLEPGERLNDADLAKYFSVSRTPVREAVIQLSEESRIIEIFPQRGMRIALIDVDLVEEARFLRLVLEKAAVELVCGQADEEDLQWLDENIRLQEFYLEGGSSRKLLELDNEMHRKLFSICRKELTYEMSQRLAIHYDRIRSLSVAAVKDHKIIEDHKKLLEAIRSRDKKLAAETMDLHLNRWMLNEQMFRDQYPAYFK